MPSKKAAAATALSFADALLDLFPESADIPGDWHDALAGAFGGDGDELDRPVASSAGLPARDRAGPGAVRGLHRQGGRDPHGGRRAVRGLVPRLMPGAAMDASPEALLRRLLEHFYCGNAGLEWSHREGCDVGDAAGCDFEAALLPYLPTSTAAELQSVIARRQVLAAGLRARAQPTPPAVPKPGDVVRFVMTGPDAAREGMAGQVCTGRVLDAGADGIGAWVTVLPLHRCIPGAVLAGRRHLLSLSEILPPQDPTQPPKGTE